MACGGGAVAPASIGPSGGAVERGEHQRGKSVSTRVEAQPKAGKGSPWRATAASAAAWLGTRVETRRTHKTKGSMSFPGSHTVDLSGHSKKTEAAGRRSTAGQTLGGAVMAASAAQEWRARPSSWRGGGGSGRGGAALGAWKSGRDGEGRPESTPAMISTRAGEGRRGRVKRNRRGDAWSHRRRRGVAAWARVYGHRKEQGSIVPTFEKF
jgi:hypothetical protein